MMKSDFSRRNFLQMASGAVNLSWGGLKISAGPPAWASDAQSSPLPPSRQPFVYGTAFYRPPNPPASERRKMLKTIAEKYQFNIIRIYPAWTYYNPAPDRFVFDDLEEVMKYCDEFELRVLLGIVMEEAPYWLERLHPETRYVDAKGTPQRLVDSANNVSGGWPGLCWDWEPVQQAAVRFIHEISKMAAAHPSMYAYDCWNEVHIEPDWPRNQWIQPQERIYCYCDQTIQMFRRWLESRYATLDALNQAWVRRYSDWNEVAPPRSVVGTYLDWIDWRNFIIERTTWQMRVRVAAIKDVDTHHLLESHCGYQPPLEPFALDGMNGWRLAEAVEAWGLSNFPRDATRIYHGAAKFEVTRSQSAGKPFWMTELQGGHGSGGLRQGMHMRPRDIRLWNWLAVAAGTKGILYWCYHAEATGGEATGYGLVDRDGSETERVVEAAEDNRLIQAHWDILKDYLPKPQVALLLDQDNSILTFAMAGQEDASVQSFRGYYKALWNMDLWADFIEPGSLGRSDYKVVIAPWHIMGKKPTCENLRRYVENGGTLILETAFGLFDEKCFYNPVIPPYGLAEAFGYREKENYIQRSRSEWVTKETPGGPPLRPADDMIYYQPDIEFTLPLRTKVRAHTFLTPITVSSATPIAKYRDLTVAAMNKVGKGEVYYVGTNLGASINEGDDAGMGLLAAIITKVAGPRVHGGKLRPRMIEGPASRSLLVVVNDTPQDQIESITLPSRYRRATDIHTQKPQAVQNGAVRVPVPYEDAVILLLE
jgi:beta-galactosidase GanA